MTAVVDLAASVVRAVNEGRAAKSGDELVAELEGVLKEVRDCEVRLAALVAVIPEIPEAPTVDARVEQCRTLLTNVEATAATDAIGAAQSEEGRTLVRELRAVVAELTQTTTAAWNDFRVTLRAEVRTDFLRKLSDLPGFGIAQSLLADNYAVQEVVVSSHVPDAEKVRQAKSARKRIDDGLRELQALLPTEIQRPLDRCFRGELRLIDVDPEFLAWIVKYELEDAFRVEAS